MAARTPSLQLNFVSIINHFSGPRREIDPMSVYVSLPVCMSACLCRRMGLTFRQNDL